MSDSVTEVETESAAGDDHHPSDLEYVKIALVLGLITSVEVFTYFESVLDWGDALIPSLLVMMVVKFWLVARMFMHLKQDKPILSGLFVTGLGMAVAVYIVALLAFQFWN